MFRHSINRPLYSKGEKLALTAAAVGLTLTLAATVAMAGSSVPQPPNAAQTFVSDAAKYGFNPQPEPPPGSNLNIRMFNPQPEPPPATISPRRF